MLAYPDDELGATIEVAYNELSREAFALWIRLHVELPHKLKGRKYISKIAGYTERHCNTILRELQLKSYIKIISGAYRSIPTKFVLIKRLLLAGDNQIINLACVIAQNFTQGALSSMGYIQPIQIQQIDVFAVKNGGIGWFQHNLLDMLRKCDLGENSTVERKKVKVSEVLCRTKSCPIDGVSPNVLLKTHQEHTVQRRKVQSKLVCKQEKSSIPQLSSKSNIPPKKADIVQKSNLFDSQKVQTNQEDIKEPGRARKNTIKRQKIKQLFAVRERRVKDLNLNLEKIQKRKEEKEERRKNSKWVGVTGGGKTEQKKAGNHDWTKPRAGEPPIITFTPGVKERQRMVEILKRRISDPERKSLVQKMTTEYLRIYTRYRRTVDLGYQTIEKERKHAESAVILCIYKNVTPTQLISHWAEHVGDFTALKFPPLSFLASPANVDRVSCEVMIDKASRQRGRKPKGYYQDGPHSSTHAFDDVSRLDSRLRPQLTAAGFDMCKYDDRYLMTIQSTARTIARGLKVFVSSKMKPLVNWAVENLYTQAVEN